MNGRVDRSQILPMIALVGFNALLHIDEFPLIVSATIIILLLWRSLCHFRGWALPPRAVLWTLVFSSIALVFYQYKIWNDEGATALLAIGVSLKLMESVKYRDVMITLLMCFYLLMSKLLSLQSFAMTLVLVADVVLIMMVMFRLHVRDAAQLKMQQWWRPALKVSLQAMPLILLLFFIFPRFSTSIIGVSPPNQASVGFSDSLDPGNVAEVAQNSQVAFRAQFKNNKLYLPEDLYWRGGTLEKSNGLNWRKGHLPRNDARNTKEGGEIEQEIVLEPLFGRWLFAFDAPTYMSFRDRKRNRHLRTYQNNSFRLKRGLEQRVFLTARSSLQGPTYAPDFYEMRENRATPKDLSQRVRQIALDIQSNEASDADKADRLMKYFKNSGMRYTLQPGPTKSIDELIFETKKGFCEHFAAAFATIMRLSGTASRVVIGFHGGKYNPVDGFYVVRQSDAHAWTEIWSNEAQQWLRYDPTTVIAPLRIQLGGQDFLSLSPEERELGANGIRQKPSALSRWLDSMSYQYDALTHRWNLFLLNYDVKTQKEILKDFGWGRHWRKILFGICVILLVAFFYFYRWWQGRQKNKIHPAAKTYGELCRWIASQGLPRQSHEGPLDYLKRSQIHWPDKAVLLRSVFTPYVKIRFEKQELNKEKIQEFDQSFRKLKNQWNDKSA